VGIAVEYAEQPSPAGIDQAILIAGERYGPSNFAFTLGDNILHGHGLADLLSLSL
jgi:glucose-1-phosphate thymidylyltransferase